MPSQSKNYKNKNFIISELSKALKKTLTSINIDPDAFKIDYDFIFDGISDTKSLEYDAVDMITAIGEDESIRLYLNNVGQIYSISLKKGWMLSSNDILSIRISTPTVEELKKAFSTIETELNLENYEKKSITNSNKDDQDEAVNKPLEPIKNSSEKENSHIEHIKKDYVKNFGPIRIYKEDLIYITKLFKNSYKKCDIQIDELIIKDEFNVDAIKTELNKDSTKFFLIRGYDVRFGSNLTLRLSKYSATITANDNEDYKSVGILDSKNIPFS